MIEMINKIKSGINADIESKAYSLQSIFSRYLDDIEALKSHGIQYQFIHKHLELGITLPHFHNLLYRAKKKRDASAIEGQKVAVSPTPVDNVKHQKPQPTPETHSKVIGRFSDSDWKAIGIHNEYLISVLQETDLTPEDVKAWNCPNQIQLSTRINEYRMRKMKRK